MQTMQAEDNCRKQCCANDSKPSNTTINLSFFCNHLMKATTTHRHKLAGNLVNTSGIAVCGGRSACLKNAVASNLTYEFTLECRNPRNQISLGSQQS